MKIGKRYQLSVHPAGAAAAAAALLFMPSREVLAALLALLLHEAGHMAAFWLCGVRSWHFELTPFGGMADAKAFELLRPVKQAAAASAGVLVSLLGAWGCALLGPRNLFIQAFVHAQLSLAFVNCLPVWPLDGARAAVALAACLGCEQPVRRALTFCAKVLGGVLVLLGLWSAWIGQCNLSLLLAGPYLWYASREGMVADRIRLLEHGIGRKFFSADAIPLAAYACADTDKKALLPKLVGRFSGERYHILVSIGEDGRLCRVMTEDEMLHHVLEMESIDGQIL